MRKLLMVMSAMFLLLMNSMAQSRQVSGVVTSTEGTPLSSVSVVVNGTAVGTQTAADGSYSLSVPEGATQITFSIVDFDAKVETIGTRTVISPVLQPSGAQNLIGVVVTGINRVKKSQFTGAANKIVSEEIKDRPVGSLDQLLQGRAPGLLAMTGSGQPGNPTNIIIRGQNSVASGVGPLYIIDGIPAEAGVFQGLNPNDIASMDVLRDAATSALYGARASGGVIVITTKRGQAGKIKVSYSAQLGVKSKPEFAFRPMSTTELLETQKQYGLAMNDNPTNDNSAIPGWYYSPENPRYQALSPADQAIADRLLDSISGINTNWYDQFFRNGTFSNHEISLSGGTGKTRFFSSLGLYNEKGIIDPSDMKRATFRNNLDYSNDKFTLQLNSNIGFVQRNFDPAFPGYIFNSFLTPAIASPYSRLNGADGGLLLGGNSGNPTYFGAQYLDLKSYDKNYNNQIKVNLGGIASYKINDNFTLSVTAGVDFRETQASVYASRAAYVRTPAATTSPTQLAGSMTEVLTRYLLTNVRPSLNYNKTFKDKHEVDVTAVAEYLQVNQKSMGFIGYGVDPRTPNTAGVFPANGVLATQTVASNANNWRENSTLASGLLMARYTFDDKYTVSGSYRKDGSSKVHPDQRWIGFYSIGAAWNVTKEKFASNSKVFNSLLVRLSYGGAGNEDNFPGNYLWQATYGTGAYAGLPTQVPTYPGNNSARWESTWTTNLGIDFEMFDRRLYGDINVYDRVTKDLFLDKPLSAEGGGLVVSLNTGELSNRGIEWNLNYDVIRNKDLTWTLFTNGAYNKNELTSLGGVEPYEEGTSFLQVGLPLGSHYQVGYAGVDASTGQPLYYDLNGNVTNVYTASNATTTHGTWEAPWKGGFGTSVKYKGFDMNVLFTWQQGNTKVDNLEYFVENFGFLTQGYNMSSSLNFWQQPGDVTNTPSPKFPINFSSKIIHDASFVRLRDVVVGYTLPKEMLANTKFISHLRFYVQASNLFMWTKWRGLDPEAGAVNLNLSEFPNPRAFTAGLNVTF